MDTDRDAWLRATIAVYQTPLTRYATRVLGDGDRARDVVQDTFVALCRAERNQVEDKLQSWLYTVCRNRALDICRREGRLEELDADAALGTDTPINELLEQQQLLTKIFERLKKLSPQQKEVVTLRYRFGLSYREISERTGLSISSVGVTMHKAIAALRRELKGGESK